ncbi:MAG: nucleotide disphospho-sugar-binding domain-containing protein, partial [Chloroflexota bacterium]
GVEQAGVRAILATGWGGLVTNRDSDPIFVLDKAPHSWLFPKMAAVVHHGGAGTTAAGIRAGRPTFISPYFGDQPYWGDRIFALGIGPKPIHQKKLTAETVAAGIKQMMTDQEMQERATALGHALSQEDGVGSAVAFIESVERGEI